MWVRLLLVVSLFAESREMVEGGTITQCPSGPPGPCGPGPYGLGPHGSGPHGPCPHGPGPYGHPGPLWVVHSWAGPLWAGPLWASLGPYGPSPHGPPWALVGRALMGVPGPLWARPLWAGSSWPPRLNFFMFLPACWSQLINVSSSYMYIISICEHTCTKPAAFVTPRRFPTCW